MYACKNIYIYIYTCKHTHLYSYIFTYIHTYIQIYIHIYICTYLPVTNSNTTKVRQTAEIKMYVNMYEHNRIHIHTHKLG